MFRSLLDWICHFVADNSIWLLMHNFEEWNVFHKTKLLAWIENINVALSWEDIHVNPLSSFFSWTWTWSFLHLHVTSISYQRNKNFLQFQFVLDCWYWSECLFECETVQGSRKMYISFELRKFNNHDMMFYLTYLISQVCWIYMFIYKKTIYSLDQPFVH